MKITRTSSFVLVTIIIGVLAWGFTRPSSAPVLVQASETVSATTGAALVDVKLPAALSAEAATGKTYYEAVCASCHGANAAGQDGIAPPLIHPLYVSSHHGDAAFVVAARNGVRQHHWSFGSMPQIQQRLTDGELNAIILYIRELQRENGIL
ncbi:c-type cytochrome [Cypionkella psychrotolerans]|uniref:c-type cytochrome n=1 Tax=Cypionkella psychrotolerans TaxID=1678131 RepID=UPI0009E746DF|nr:c-type cytochrome [Cypionkella psychrotolerans]